VSRKGKGLAGVLAGAGLLLAAAGQAAAPAPVAHLVGGTAHQALFAVSTWGNAGVAVGAAGAIMESGDAGKTWKAVTPAPTPLSLLGVSVRQGHAVAVGQVGTVLVMDDSGKWVKADAGTDSRLFGVSVNAGGVAVAVGAFGTIIRSTDGGKTWATAAPDWNGYAENGEQPHLYDVNVDDNGVITAIGEFGLILRSADGGKTWKTLHKGDASLFALEVLPDGGGYAVGQNGVVLHSTDHGDTWNEVKVGTGAILLGVHAVDGKVLITGLHDMLLSRDNGQSWERLSSEEINTTWYQGTAGGDGGRPLLAVGHAGQIVRIAE
jgi:photosystem II stability/assembly factor-like uncharacterized protein